MLDGERDQLVGFRNAEVVLYPVSRHVFLAGTIERATGPPFNFHYFARVDTMTMLRAEPRSTRTSHTSCGATNTGIRSKIGPVRKRQLLIPSCICFENQCHLGCFVGSSIEELQVAIPDLGGEREFGIDFGGNAAVVSH